MKETFTRIVDITLSTGFAAGVLQGFLFNNDRPKYMNYGAIGYVIGHEITHGFDDIGKQFDKDGNIVDWWTPSTEKNYVQRRQCIIQQYRNYRVQELDLKVNACFVYIATNPLTCL